MIVAELKQALDAAGVEYPSDARKADLEQLHAEISAGTGTSAVSPVPAEPSVARIGTLGRLRHQATHRKI